MNISILRMLALKQMPYMASLLYTIRPTEKKGVGTMAVREDGVMYYDPEWVEKIGPQLAAGVLLHEAMHLLRRHHARCRAFNPEDPQLWNAAIDMEINDDLAAAGVLLPQDGQFVENYDLPTGHTAEFYYNELVANSIKIEMLCQCCVGGNEGEDGEESEGGNGGNFEAHLRIEKALNDVAKQIQERVGKKGQGSVPGGLKKWANAALGVLDWRKLLRIYVSRALGYRKEAVDYTWKRISRRQGLNYGLGNPVMPGVFAPEPKVVVALDTSGSMDGSIDIALGELAGILKAIGVGVWFISGDAEVAQQCNVRDIAKAREMVQGFGGTDFRPLFEAAAKQKPDLFVYLTDGYGDAPARKPPFETIWCLTPGGRAPVTWGKQVRIDITEQQERDYDY